MQASFLLLEASSALPPKKELPGSEEKRVPDVKLPSPPGITTVVSPSRVAG